MARVLRIATFNLENLDDKPGLIPGIDERSRILRPQLLRLNADVLCLQEVNAQQAVRHGPRELRALDKVCFIIIKAREFDVKEDAETEEDGSNPADDDMREVLANYPDDATYQELKSFLQDMNEDEMADLIALSWLGRGDYTGKEWAEAQRESRTVIDKKATDYLLGIPLLADFLEEGLNELGLSCEDVEKEHLPRA